MSLSKFRELVIDREVWRAVVHGVAKSRTRLSDWTDWMCYVDFPGGIVIENLPANAGDAGDMSSTPGSLGQENPLE